MGWQERLRKLQETAQLEQRLEEAKQQGKVMVFCPDDQWVDEVHEVFTRTKNMLNIVKEYLDSLDHINEDEPDQMKFAHQIAPLMNRFMTDMMMNYPSGEDLLNDLEMFKSISVRK